MFLFRVTKYTPISLIIMSAGQEKPLAERVEVPGVSKEAAKKISHLEQEFIRAEVEQRMFL